MFQIKRVLYGALCGVALLQFAAALPAAANTIEIFKADGVTEAGTLSDGTGTITFLGFTAPGVTSSTTAVTSPQTSDSNPGTEAALLNSYAGTTFTGADETKSGDNPPNPLSITGAYFLLKLDGPNTGYAIFQNVSGGSLSLTYTEVGTASGLSHVSQFGAAAVPGPIVGAGLPGLIVACGALLALARRRRQQIA